MSDEQPTYRPDNPGVRVPPPIFILAVVLLGYGLQRVWALELPSWSGWLLAAYALLCGFAVLLIAGWVHFYRAETNVLHHRPSSTLIRSGLYRVSRNPIYVSGLLLQLGIALLLNNVWILLLVPASKFLLDRYVIAREEAYLERAYGEVYVDYTRSVRRWL